MGVNFEYSKHFFQRTLISNVYIIHVMNIFLDDCLVDLTYFNLVGEKTKSFLKLNQRLSRACIVHLVIKRTNWSYVKTMSCSGSHLGITINIKKHKVCKGPSND